MNGECSNIRLVFDKLLKEVGSPVEFLLPDWLKNQNPMPYTFNRCNMYLTKKIKKRVEDDGIFCSCNSPTGSYVCGKDCHCGIPQRMLLSSCSSSCKCGSSCLNKPFHQRPVKKMKLVKTWLWVSSR